MRNRIIWSFGGYILIKGIKWELIRIKGELSGGYIEVLLIFRVLESIDELYFYYCCLRISPLLLENVALRMGNLQVIQFSRSGGSSVLGL